MISPSRNHSPAPQSGSYLASTGVPKASLCEALHSQLLHKGGSSDNDSNAPAEDSVAEFKAQYTGIGSVKADSNDANGTDG